VGSPMKKLEPVKLGAQKMNLINGNHYLRGKLKARGRRRLNFDRSARILF